MLSAVLTAATVLMQSQCPCGSAANNDAPYFRRRRRHPSPRPDWTPSQPAVGYQIPMDIGEAV
jgi:hypothetical protein